MIDRNEVQRLFEKWIRKLRLVPDWDIILEWVEDPDWRKIGDFYIGERSGKFYESAEGQAFFEK